MIKFTSPRFESALRTGHIEVWRLRGTFENSDWEICLAVTRHKAIYLPNTSLK